MARVSNARSSHVERWVVPAAREILIQEACKDAPTKFLDEVAFLEMGQSPSGESVNEDGNGTPFIGGPSDLGIEFPNTNRFTTAPNKLSQQNLVT
jgi:type I restriction enzyme, S subunit